VAREPIRLPRRVGPGGRTVEYAPNRWTPDEVERRIADEPVEWLYVFDRSGRQIARFRGTPDDVDLSDELKARTEGMYGESLLRNHTMVHNHPPVTGGDAVPSLPPSPSDLLLAVEGDLRELVVVSGGWRYSVRRPGAHWPTDEYDMHRIISAKQAELLREFGPVEAFPAAPAARQVLVLERLAQEGWIEYEAVAFPRGVR
jgi:hypothetical protein